MFKSLVVCMLLSASIILLGNFSVFNNSSGELSMYETADSENSYKIPPNTLFRGIKPVTMVQTAHRGHYGSWTIVGIPESLHIHTKSKHAVLVFSSKPNSTELEQQPTMNYESWIAKYPNANIITKKGKDLFEVVDKAKGTYIVLKNGIVVQELPLHKGDTKAAVALQQTASQEAEQPSQTAGGSSCPVPLVTSSSTSSTVASDYAPAFVPVSGPLKSSTDVKKN